MKRYDSVPLQTLSNDLEMELTKLAKLERVIEKTNLVYLCKASARSGHGG